ncbi:MAG: L-histidine N(alpha)-methyltransferase [Planctomycetota bacterium]
MSAERPLPAPDFITTFRRDVIKELSRSPKSLPSKYFYDQRGSLLFDQICTLDEYYLTRSETEIMREYADEIGQAIGEGVMLVEYGSGSSAKSRLLLDRLLDPVAYVAVDISHQHLLATSDQLRRDYSQLEIIPVIADFSGPFQLPKPKTRPRSTTVYFPGSTIGNLLVNDAVQLLKSIAQQCGKNGQLVIGIDLQKDVKIIERAYNDAEGITAKFNLNLLDRINRELDASIDLSGFAHVARYNQSKHRIDMFLRSERPQTIVIGETQLVFNRGELIHTEYSHKYTIKGFADLAAKSGLTLVGSWTDQRGYFAVLHFATAS